MIFHIFHGYVRQNPPFPTPKSSWPPMGSMDIHGLEAMTAIRSSCFERLGCLGRPLELWLTPQISQCGNLWKSVEICGMLDLSGSISLAHPNAEARCPVHVSRYRGIAHLSGGDYGKTTRSSHFTKDAVQKF